MDIGSSNIDEEDEDKHGYELMECIKECACKNSLRVFNWGYDAFERNELIEALLNVLGNREDFPSIERIELAETLEEGKKRNELRKEFANKGIKLILSDR